MLCTSCDLPMLTSSVPMIDGDLLFMRCVPCNILVVDSADAVKLSPIQQVGEPGQVFCPACKDIFLDEVNLGTSAAAPHRRCRICGLISFNCSGDLLHHGLDPEISPLGQFLTYSGLLLRDEKQLFKDRQLPASFHIDNGRATGLKCPHCAHGLTLYSVYDRHKEAGADFDICDHCFGIWLDREDLLGTRNLPAVHSLTVNYETIEPSSRACPKCREINLFSMSFNELDTVVDCCPDCYGTWLDGGELAEFCDFLQGDNYDVIDALIGNAIFNKPFFCKTLQRYSQTLFRLDEKVAAQDWDLEQAQAIQTRLLFGETKPTALPIWNFGPYSVAGYWEPAKTVGGDYFDLIPLNLDGSPHLLMCIADVSGKGIPAALLMANFQALLRSFASGNPAPGFLAGALNRVLCQNTASNKFITAFLGLLNLETHQLTYTNAGHNAPILVGAEEQLLMTGGTVLGLLPEWSYNEAVLVLGETDRLLLYTDGVSEATDAGAEELGESRMVNWLNDTAAKGQGDAMGELIRSLREYCQGQFDDDATMLLIGRNP